MERGKANVMSLSIEPLTMSVREAAAFVGIGRTKMHALIAAKRIACKMLDGRIRVTAQSLRDFLDNLPDGYTPGKPVKDATEPPKPKKSKRKTVRS